MHLRAVTNSTCLIGLERIARLDLLPQVFSVIVAPSVVQTEVGFSVEWLEIQDASNREAALALGTQLDAGEAEAIALARELGDTVVILDDKKARRIAREMGLRVLGTAGILVRAKRQGILSQVEPLLKALQQAGFHMTKILYHETLRLANESQPGSQDA